MIEVAYISYMQRASMLEVIRSDFIRTARAKGLSERQVIWGHGFKNAVIPVMTIAGIDLGALIGGAIITETVFAWPGLGLRSTRSSAPATCPWPAACSSPPSCTCLANLFRRPRIRLGRPTHPPRRLSPVPDRDTSGNQVTQDLPSSARSASATIESKLHGRKPLGLWADSWRRPSANHRRRRPLHRRRFLAVGMTEEIATSPGSDRATPAPGTWRPTAPTPPTTRSPRKAWARPPSCRTRSAPTSWGATCSRGPWSRLAAPCSSASSPSPSRWIHRPHPWGRSPATMGAWVDSVIGANSRRLLRLPLTSCSCCSS